MLYFMCYGCGYLLKLGEGQPPRECPACGQAYGFVNVTSYRPEIGVGNPDPEVMASLLKEAATWKRTKAPARDQGLMGSHLDALCREAAQKALRELLEQKRKAGVLRERGREPVPA